MAFFDLVNAPSAPKPAYMRGTELPLFVPLKITKIEAAVTVNGPTTKIEAVMGSSKIFFYLNAEDHGKIVEHDGVRSIMAMVNSHQNPFCFSVKTRTNFAIRFIPFDAELVLQARNKGQLKLSQLPASVLSEIDLEGLAQMGIVFEE